MQQPRLSDPVSLCCVAASADAAFLIQWERHLLPLQQAGHITCWSERHIPPGEDRLACLQEHLDGDACLVFLLSADFFDDEECSALMQRAVRRAQAGGAVLVPLLLRPVEWEESALGTFTSQPANGKAITKWTNQDEAWHSCVQGIRQLLGLPTHVSTVSTRDGETRPNLNRDRMLGRLRKSYRDLLAQSLQGVAWMELGLAERLDAVQNVATLSLRLGQFTEQPLPVGTTIAQVYQDAGQELLVLGAPGAGKSTLLYQLAQQLVIRAERDEMQLLPVVLPLSSWAVKQGPLIDWISEQLVQIYDVPRKVGREWVLNEQIAPLLDGLDEMEEAARPACIAAINAYHRAHLTPLVVCSRSAEYEIAARKERLALQSAVEVRSLTLEQVDAILLQVGEPVAALRTAIHEQPDLRELVTRPLMLNVLMLTYKKGSALPTGSLKGMLLEQRVWTDYLERMVREKGAERQGKGDTPIKLYELEQTRTWLGWLARQMDGHDQTIFYAENLEADWLADGQRRAYAWLALRLPALTIGFLVSVLIGLFLGSVGTDFVSLLQVGLIGGFLAEWLSQDPGAGTVSLEGRTRGEKRFPTGMVSRLLSSVHLGLLFGASFGLNFGNGYTAGDWFRDGLIYGIGIAISGWVLQSLLLRLSRQPVPLPIGRERRRFRLSGWFKTVNIRPAGAIAIVLGTALGVCAGLRYGLSAALSTALSTGLSAGLSAALNFGIAGLLLGVILDEKGGIFRFAERLHWNGRYLITPGHLRTSVLLASLIFIIVGLSTGLSIGLIYGLSSALSFGLINGLSIGLSAGLSYGLSAGLSAGLSYWVLFGVYQGIVQERIEDRDRRTFNRRIRRSLRNGAFISLASGGFIGGIGILSAGLSIVLSIVLSAGLNNWLDTGPYYPAPSVTLSAELGDILSYGLRLGWFIAISGGLLVWAMIGGLTVLRHYALRFLLARSRTFPWRAQAFLDDATARILLRRVDGGYSFVHRRLLDFFATADAPTPEKQDEGEKEHAPVQSLSTASDVQ